LADVTRLVALTVTVRCARTMRNCTDVNGRHRNGWTGYTKVYEPARGDGRFGRAMSIEPGLFRIYPIRGAENGRARLQIGKINSIESQKTNIDGFRRSIP
jgi:hypothetical protein